MGTRRPRARFVRVREIYDAEELRSWTPSRIAIAQQPKMIPKSTPQRSSRVERGLSGLCGTGRSGGGFTCRLMRERPALSAAGFDLFPRPLRCPADLTSGDPIVRSAREAPVADRGLKRNRASVKDEAPVRGRKRGYDLAAAPAATPMIDGGVGQGDIQDPVVE